MILCKGFRSFVIFVLAKQHFRASVTSRRLYTRDRSVLLFFLFGARVHRSSAAVLTFLCMCLTAADAKDLIESCLSVTASKRPTLDQVLNHRWTRAAEFPFIDTILS